MCEKESQKSDDEFRSSTVSSHLIMLRAQHHKKGEIFNLEQKSSTRRL